MTKGPLRSNSRTSRNTIFSRRVIIPISVALVLLLAAALYFVIIDSAHMRNQLYAEFNRQQAILAGQAAFMAAADLEDLQTALRQLRLRVENAKSTGELRTLLANALFLSGPKGLIEIGALDSGGAIVETVGIPDVPRQSKEYLAHDLDIALKSNSAIAPLRIQSLTPDSVLVSANIFFPAGRSSGHSRYLFARIDVTELLYTATMGLRFVESGSVWVIDQSGMILYHSDRTVIGANAFASSNAHVAMLTAVADDKNAGALLSGQDLGTEVMNVTFPGKESAQLCLTAWHRISAPLLTPAHRWMVAITAPRSTISAPVRTFQSRHLLIGLLIIAVLIILLVVLAVFLRRTTHSLKEQVSRQEEYMSVILQNSVDGIILIDNDNRIKVWNKGAEMIFGYTTKEMLGQSFYRLIPDDINAEKELEHIRCQVYDNGHIRNYQTYRKTKDGRRITVNISRTLVTDSNGTPVGSAAVIKDVTEKIELDKHLYNAEKLASIGILAAGVAHEINNPLAVILGFADLLKEKCKQDSAEYTDLEAIEENANHAKHIVENLLGFAHLTEGSSSSIDIKEAIGSCLNMQHSLLDQKKISVVTNIDDGLSPVAGDAREFQQVIFNLVTNAVQAMKEDGGTLEIAAHEVNGELRISVRDTGCGIPERIKPQIFDPFFTTKEVGQGTGLGLSLVHGIVHKMGGAIAFESTACTEDAEAQHGTTFIVTLPAMKTSAVGKGAERETKDPGGR